MSSLNFENRMKQLLESELLRSCANGDKDAVAQLVDDKEVALDCIDEVGLQPLMIASKQGYFQIVQYLLWHNTDILDNTDSAGWSALHWSTLNGHYLISKELIEFGADLDLLSFSDLIYPLHLSIFANKPSICKLLLDNHCKIDILYNNNQTIDEFLDYVQFKLKLLSKTQIDKFKNIIYHSKQYIKNSKQSSKNINIPTLNTANNASNNSDTEIEIVLRSEEEDAEVDIDDFEQIKRKYFNDSDSEDSTDSEIEDTDTDANDIGDIISLLPQISNSDTSDDEIIEEKEQKTEDTIVTVSESEQTNNAEITESNVETKTETKTETPKTFANNGIVSLNLDLLIESISDKINDKIYERLYDKLSETLTEKFEETFVKSTEFEGLSGEISETQTNGLNALKETQMSELKEINTNLSKEMDNKLSKYEEWLRSNIEDKIDKIEQLQSELTAKMTKINAFMKKQKQKTHSKNQPSIETLKVGRIIERELFKKKEIKLNQSFTDGESDDSDNGINDIQRLQHIINIQQNIFNSNTKLSVKSRQTKQGKNGKQLQKKRHSGPTIIQSINSMSANINSTHISHSVSKSNPSPHSVTDFESANDSGNDSIFATVEALTPIQMNGNGNGKVKPKKMRRKRSNSYSQSPKESPTKDNGYWE